VKDEKKKPKPEECEGLTPVEQPVPNALPVDDSGGGGNTNPTQPGKPPK